jgi:hypothetical protein
MTPEHLLALAADKTGEAIALDGAADRHAGSPHRRRDPLAADRLKLGSDHADQASKVRCCQRVVHT